MTARLRAEIAACTRILNDLELLGYSGHVSARLPDGAGLLIQSFDQSRATLTPDELLVCDLDGRKLSGPEGERPPAEVFLHTEILRARPDVMAVAHFHHDLTTSFSLAEGPKLHPVKNHAVRWADGIPEHPDPSHVANPALGRALAATLGPHHALQIRAHGQVVCAESLPALLVDCVHFVENATALYHAACLGKLRPLRADELAAFARDFRRAPHIVKLWHYFVSRARARGIIPPDWQLEAP